MTLDSRVLSQLTGPLGGSRILNKTDLQLLPDREGEQVSLWVGPVEV